MKHEVETELKMLLKSEDVRKLLAGSFKNIPFIHQLNTYYRSNNHTHYAFRIRQKNGESLFTLKEHRDGEVVEGRRVRVRRAGGVLQAAAGDDGALDARSQVLRVEV